jgi:YidC/Oxa1 family membrane protein insertase
MQPNNAEGSRNMIIAMVLTLAIVLGWSYLKPPETKPVVAQQVVQPGLPTTPAAVAAVPQTRESILGSQERIALETPSMKGSIRLKGARIDDVTLIKYPKTVDDEKDYVTLLAPDQTEKPYFADFGWMSGTATIKLPDAETPWQIKGNKTLKPDAPVTLEWRNGQGLTFVRTLQVDENYVFTITDKIKNDTAQSFSLHAYGTIARENMGEVSSFFILHEGPIGYLQDKLVEAKYEDLNKKPASYDSLGGWAGLTDKYWLTALIPPQNANLKVTYRGVFNGKDHRYYADYVGPAMTLEGNGSIEFTNHFFAGAKVLKILDHYDTTLGIKHFDSAVDFGWFYFMTKPIFYILTFAKEYLGNFGLGILALTIILKILFFPLANKSYRSMARMKALQPKMARLKELYKDDKIRMNQELMELYKKEKVNPMAGCLPMLVQIPVFFALYKVLFVSIEMRQAPFYGWIHDLSAPDPTSFFNLFGLIPWTPPSFLQIGAWPLIMGATMLLQQKMNPAPADPMQEKLFMLMPVVFTFMLASFPAGLVIYWAWNNVLTIGQQAAIMYLDGKHTSK